MKKCETKRSLQAKETKKRIYSAALKLFDERDIDSVTISDIAREANCSPGNIYHYFKSKEEIAVKTLQPVDEKYTDFYERLQSEEQFLTLSASGQLMAFFCESVRICTTDPQLQSAYVLALKNPGLRTLRMNENREFYKISTELLRRMEQTGELSSQVGVEEARDMLLTLLRGILTEWIISGQEFDPVERARALIVLMLKGAKN